MKKLDLLLSLALVVLVCSCGDDDGGIIEPSNDCACSTAPVEFQVGSGQVFVPNIFSPNGDGINDIFLPFAGSEVDEIESFTVSNLDGEMLFSQVNFPPNDVGKSWDAQVNSETFAGQFQFAIRARSAAGVVESFTGMTCSFPCIDISQMLMDIGNCWWGTQHDGEGGPDAFAPSFENLDCF